MTRTDRAEIIAILHAETKRQIEALWQELYDDIDRLLEEDDEQEAAQ